MHRRDLDAPARSALARDDAIGLARQPHLEQARHQKLIVGAAEVAVATSVAAVRGAAQNAAKAYVVGEGVPTAEILIRPPYVASRSRREGEPHIRQHRSVAGPEGASLEPRLPFAAVLSRRIDTWPLGAGVGALRTGPFCLCRLPRRLGASPAEKQRPPKTEGSPRCGHGSCCRYVQRTFLTTRSARGPSPTAAAARLRMRGRSNRGGQARATDPACTRDSSESLSRQRFGASARRSGGHRVAHS